MDELGLCAMGAVTMQNQRCAVLKDAIMHASDACALR